MLKKCGGEKKLKEDGKKCLKTLDIDFYKRFRITNHYFHVYKIQNLLFNLFYLSEKMKIRISSSGKGIHIILISKAEVEYLDDYLRQEIEEIRKKYGIFHHVLFKCKDGKVAGDWIYIESEKDIIDFITNYFRFIF